MLTPTHLLTAQAAYLGACVAVGHPPTVPEAAVTLLAGIAPDLGQRQGIVGRLAPWLSAPLEHTFGHRTFTHSLLLQLGILIPAFAFLPFGFALALAAGLVSHSISDMMTEGGVCWFWPSRARCVLPGNPRYRVQLMSWGELAFAALMAGAGIGFMALSHQAEGTAGLIRSAIGSIAAAREQYDAEKGGHAFTLRIEGRDNRGYQPINGEYPVLGEWQEGGFILDAGGRYVSACKGTGCDWHADKAVLVKGAEQITTTTHHEGKAVTVEALREALQEAQGVGAVYLVGSARSEAVKPAPPILEATAGRVELHFYPAARLDEWPAVTLRDLDLSIQVRHPPETVLPEVVIPDDPDERIDPLLGRWIGHTAGDDRKEATGGGNDPKDR